MRGWFNFLNRDIRIQNGLQKTGWTTIIVLSEVTTSGWAEAVSKGLHFTRYKDMCTKSQQPCTFYRYLLNQNCKRFLTKCWKVEVKILMQCQHRYIPPIPLLAFSFGTWNSCTSISVLSEKQMLNSTLKCLGPIVQWMFSYQRQQVVSLWGIWVRVTLKYKNQSMRCWPWPWTKPMNKWTTKSKEMEV